MPFGDHLRSDQHVDVSGGKFEQHIFELAFVGHRVAVNPGDTHRREFFGEHILDSFGTLADKIEVFAFAFWTNFRRFFAVIAVMTDQLVITAMKCKRDVAVFAFHRLAARAAKHKLRKTAPI